MWFLVLTGILILLTFSDQPLVLLIISAALSGFVTGVASLLLIKLNRGVLPEAIKMRGVRFGAMILSAAVFGILSFVALYQEVVSNLLGG